MRNDKRYFLLVFLLAVALLAAVAAVHNRVERAIGEFPLPPELRGSVATRDGEIVYDGSSTKYPEFKATIANVASGSRGNHLSSNTLGKLYEQNLKVGDLTAKGGVMQYEGMEPRVMTTTLLPGAAQQRLREAFGDYNGALFAYNYKTGEIYTVLSLPTSHMENLAFGTYSSGSTMKVVTLVAALTQNPELQNFTYTCTGAFKPVSGKNITCDGKHGKVDMTTAIGKSCNCYFAALIQELDVDTTRDILTSLGFNSIEDKKGTGSIGKLTYSTGFATFKATTSFDEIWKLIGQGNTVSLVDMARIAGAVANGGSSADPYVVQSIYDPNEDTYIIEGPTVNVSQLVDPDTADLLAGMWSEAVRKHYHTRKVPLDARVTYAKTGTAELTDADGKEYHNRLMIGAMEEYSVAFMLVTEHVPEGSTQIFTVANTLAQVIAEAGL